MHVNPYGADPVHLAVDLLRDPPATPEELTDRCARAGVVVGRPATETDLRRTRVLLRDWERILDANSERERADLVNALLRRFSTFPRLTDHDGIGWHLHYREPERPLAGVLGALIAVGTALHLTGRGMHRLGRCADPTCRRPFADVSRTGRQRYCAPACANREGVRRHRARTPDDVRVDLL